MSDKTVPGTSIVEEPVPDAEKGGLGVVDPTRYTYDDPFGEAPPDEQKPADEKPKEEKPVPAGGTPPPEPAKPADTPFVPPAVPEVTPPATTVATGEVEQLRSQVTERETENANLKKELDSLKDVKASLEAIKKDPISFIREHVPHLADKLDVNRHIQDQLRKEFGNEFNYDGTDAYREGTDSYRYRLRESELRDAVAKRQHEIAAKQALDAEQHQRNLEASKKKVMTDFKLTDEQFNEQVYKWSLGKVITFEDIARLRFFDQIVKAASDKAVEAYKKGAPAPPPTSPAAINTQGTDEGIPEHLKDFHDEFGD